MKTGAAIVAGLVAILLVSGAVTVWASSTGPRAAMPAAWTAQPSSPPEVTVHPTVPVATGNRATASATPSGSRTSTAAATTSVSKQASTSSTTKVTTSQTLQPCSAGQTVSTTVFSLKVPTGWKCFEQATSGTQAVIALYNESMDVIQVSVSPSKDAVTACGAYLATQSTGVVAQPDTAWGGKPAKTAKVTVSSLTAQARCVESKGVIYMMVGAAGKGTYDSVVTSMSAVATAWVWK